MNKYSLIFVDDDFNLAAASEDLLRLHLLTHGLELVMVSSVPSLAERVKLHNDVLPILAIVDLWLQPDAEGGFKIIEMLRNAYPNIFIIVYSAHIDERAEIRLHDVKQITIVKKPSTIALLTRLIDQKLAQMMGE
jgi:DNA-binding NtrC family response regulator